jgi:hypothetical protein
LCGYPISTAPEVQASPEQPVGSNTSPRMLFINELKKIVLLFLHLLYIHSPPPSSTKLPFSCTTSANYSNINRWWDSLSPFIGQSIDAKFTQVATSGKLSMIVEI